ncbi:hypothetical protein EIP86_005018 [Pleurotus ostreatoroseus]|nr:hypothetical protein EIP86_005018 [Pleurotus ostreatoroseus]
MGQPCFDKHRARNPPPEDLSVDNDVIRSANGGPDTYIRGGALHSKPYLGLSQSGVVRSRMPPAPARSSQQMEDQARYDMPTDQSSEDSYAEPCCRGRESNRKMPVGGDGSQGFPVGVEAKTRSFVRIDAIHALVLREIGCRSWNSTVPLEFCPAVVIDTFVAACADPKLRAFPVENQMRRDSVVQELCARGSCLASMACHNVQTANASRER